MNLEIQRTSYRTTAAQASERVWWPFLLVAGAIMLALMGSSTPTPLYGVYAAQWHFSSLDLTEVYAVYAVAVLAALLGTGSLSDAVGRRPVIVAALSGLAGAMIAFTFASGLDWLYAARTLQGLATGLLLGATGAALIDLHPRRDGAHAGLVNGIASAAGIGVGAGLSGLLVEYLPRPEVLPFVVIATLSVLLAAAAWRLPEPVVRSGSVSLRPRMPGVPRALWRTFALSGLGVLAAWSVGGLYLSLGPSIVNDLHPTTNLAIGGLFVFAVCAFATGAQWVLRTTTIRATLVGGAGSLAVGSAATAAAIHASSLTAFLAGSVVVGFGFGAAFTGALRSLAAVLAPAHRAGVMSAFFVVAYASISIPAIGAGLAAGHVGVASAATWFGAAVAVVAALVAVIGWFELRPADQR